MKRFLLLILLVVQPSFGIDAIINCASTNIAQTYSTSFPSLAITTGHEVSHFALFNNTAGRICSNTTTASSSSAPSASNGSEHCVPPYSFAIWDGVDVPQNTKNIYLRGDAATCTTGIVDADIW
jgi:hypothetical protein